jgi:hypothetical protein
MDDEMSNVCITLLNCAFKIAQITKRLIDYCEQTSKDMKGSESISF